MKWLPLLLLAGFWFRVSAELPFDSSVLQTCELKGSVKTTPDLTQIFCDGDLHIAPGTQIVLGCGSLQMVSVGNIYLGEGTTITTTAEPCGPRHPEIEIQSATAFGHLRIVDHQKSAFITLTLLSTARDYRQDIESSAQIKMSISGDDVDLVGPGHRLAGDPRGTASEQQ